MVGRTSLLPYLKLSKSGTTTNSISKVLQITESQATSLGHNKFTLVKYFGKYHGKTIFVCKWNVSIK